MKKSAICFSAIFIVLTAACEKQEINPSNPTLKNEKKECKRCQGTWDITDTSTTNSEL